MEIDAQLGSLRPEDSADMTALREIEVGPLGDVEVVQFLDQSPLSSTQAGPLQYTKSNLLQISCR